MKTNISTLLPARASERSRPPTSTGFTLIELLVVIAILILLAALLVPALSKAKAKAHAIQCLNNLNQMGLSWLLYTHDNNDAVPPNSVENTSDAKTWVMGWLDFSNSPANTNTFFLQTSLLWRYHQSLGIWRCPSDESTSEHGGKIHPRVRSYSMNNFLNPRCEWTGGKIILKTTDMIEPSPSKTFVLLDERADSINEGVFLVDMEEKQIFDWPANYHRNGSAISFADGHCELKKWLDSRTTPPARKGELLSNGGTASPGNRDLRWLRERTTSVAP
jgi:prepilin-type N-terminal cleavage/methylation domain-containing protein/prepilin-type processing-associated H-X9-DG protein